MSPILKNSPTDITQITNRRPPEGGLYLFIPAYQFLSLKAPNRVNTRKKTTARTTAYSMNVGKLNVSSTPAKVSPSYATLVVTSFHPKPDWLCRTPSTDLLKANKSLFAELNERKLTRSPIPLNNRPNTKDISDLLFMYPVYHMSVQKEIGHPKVTD